MMRIPLYRLQLDGSAFWRKNTSKNQRDSSQSGGMK